MAELVGRRYDTGAVVRLSIQGETIRAVTPVSGPEAQRESLPWLAPGLVDLQVNGYGGRELTDAQLTQDSVRSISLAMDQDGVTGYCPTVTTQSFEVQRHALATIAKACDEDQEVASRVVGIHLEGPYIAAEDGPRGAHPRAHCRPPDWDEWQRLQESARGRIRLITLSPEYDNSVRFIERLVEEGVLVAIGHTAAQPDQIRAAVAAGARMSTHLGNGAHGQIRRHPNYIWEQLAADDLCASLIADGHHLPPSVVKSFVRAKTPARCVLVSDITGLGGMPAGRYSTPLGDVEVLDDGRLVVAGQRQLLAGAALPVTYGVANVMRYAGVSLDEAITMASIRPAQLIGIAPARLEAGSRADLILFDVDCSPHATQPLQILATLHRGTRTYGQL